MNRRNRIPARSRDVAPWAIGLAAMVLCAALTDPAAARQARAAHTVGLGIHPIVAFAIQTSGADFVPGSVRNDAFALTSNIDDTRLVASLSAPLPAGLTLAVQAQTDLSRAHGLVLLDGTAPVVVLEGVARGVRSGQTLQIEIGGSVEGIVERTLYIGLEDPVSGTSSVQAVPVRINGRSSTS